MRYFFVSEPNGQTHIIAASSAQRARQIAGTMRISDLYELTEDAFKDEGFLVSDLRKNK